MSATAVIFICTLLLVPFLWYLLLGPPKNLPPGPPCSLLQDNTKDVSPACIGIVFRSWNQKYGPVISCYISRKPVIVLGTVKTVRDLFEKRGNIYSGRPRNVMSQEILSGNMRNIGKSYGTQWKNWRRLLQAGLGSTVVTSYRSNQLFESAILLRDLVLEADLLKYSDHIRRLVSSINLYIAYGIRVDSLQDEIVLKNLRTEQYFTKLQTPGQYLVNSYPILLYLPKCLQWFRHEADHHRKLDTEMYLSYLNQVRSEFEEGSAPESIAVHALSKQQDFGMSDIEVAYALSSPWAAGTGTTTFTFEAFLLAMQLYPQKMRKAQEEIDRVVGRERMPDFNDLNGLFYVQALIKEVMRWRPITPLGVPHMVMEDDIYEGMFIPKGSTIYANIFAMTRDPEMFPDPDKFVPERFINTDDSNLINFAIPFGMGRRLCPGLHIAKEIIFINIARILWAFDVLPPNDENGKSILPMLNEPGSGFLWRPNPFKCEFKPRLQSVREMITREAECAGTEFKIYSARASE